MSNNHGYDEKQHDDWLKNESDVAALVMRQRLVPVEGPDAVIFPPTYPIEQNKAGYNIDRFDDGSNVCQIDSVGSQANRMEPIFKRDKYKHLVPQVVIKADDREIHILDAGHRAADAIVRFSELGPELHRAFQIYRDIGNAKELAKIAPTSIVFGAWDSRATQAKLPRIVRSVIRAYNVKELHRSAQYSTISGEILAEGNAEVTTTGPKAELGLAHVPAVHTHGGVQIQGEIRRDAILNLSALRALADPAGDDETLRLRRYILGLALVSFTAPMEPCLREGCELVCDPNHTSQWMSVKHNGTREELALTHDQAFAFATAAAESFGVGESRTVHFNHRLASQVLELNEKDRKKLLKQGPVTTEAIEKLSKGSKAQAKGKKRAMEKTEE